MMTLSEIFHSFSRLKVLVIGDVMMDKYIIGDVSRVSPEAPVPIIAVTDDYFRLGGAGNVALNIRSLGARPVLCALVGQDDAGVQLLERLETVGIGTEGIVTSTHRPTTVKTRLLAGHQHVARIDNESAEGPDAAEVKALLGRVEKLVEGCDVILFEDYDKGTLNRTIIESVVERARQLNIPTVVDPKKKHFDFYKGVTLFKPNLKELKEGLKIEIEANSEDQINEAVKLLKHKLEAEAILVTLSEKGVLYYSGDVVVSHPSHIQEIADVSGAGDTVVSIAALCTALKLSPHVTANLSNLGGGLVCQHVGVVPVNKDELLAAAERLIGDD